LAHKNVKPFDSTQVDAYADATGMYFGPAMACLMSGFSPLHLAISSRRRRFLALASLVCYLSVSSGFPLPQPMVAKTSGERFPCEKHACGCTSAAQCWHDCCCTTLDQRLAWAETNNVVVPEDIRSQLVLLRATPKRACCANRDAHSRQDSSTRTCCTQPKVDRSKRSTTLVLPQLVRQCRGLASSWISCGAVTPPPARTTCPFDLSFVDWLIVADPSLNAVSRSPDIPPPRV
jgi:hypothetical protein